MKRQKRQRANQLKIRIPEKQLDRIASLLEKKALKEKRNKNYASTKEVLSLLAQGAILTFSFAAPNMIKLLGEFKKKPNKNEWRRFNLGYLKRTLKRLEKQKLIKIEINGNKTILKISDQGKMKVLKYTIGELELEKKRWDKKWRLVLYDIPNHLNISRDQIRKSLKNLGFLEIQKSVYLTPFPCFDQVDFLRTIFHLRKYMKIIWVDKIENEKVYKNYFGV